MGILLTRRRLIAAQPHLASASGSIVSVDDAVAAALKSCIVTLNPIQSGSGDPSPDNVRPITGRTGANVYRTGKNLFDKAHPNIIEGYFGVGQPSNIVEGVSFRTVYIPATPNTTYTVKNNASNRLYVGYNDIAPISGGTLTKSIASVAGVATITTDGNAHYLAAYVYNSNADTVSFDDVLNGLQIELGSNPSAYAPYSGTTIPVTFPDPPGTVYGGTLNLISGKLTVDKAYLYMDGSVSVSNVSYHQLTGLYFTTVANPIRSINTSISEPHLLSSRFKTKNGVAVGQTYITGDGKILVAVLPDQTAATKEQVNAWFTDNPTQFVYDLAEPIVYDLTPHEITTLVGRNVMWTDGDGLTVKYWARP